jgi:uncharacterized protein YcfL
MRYVLLFFMALNLAGCVSQRAVLVNERGEELTCETTGYGFIASMMASNKQTGCVSDAERRGYRVKEQNP